MNRIRLSSFPVPALACAMLLATALVAAAQAPAAASPAKLQFDMRGLAAKASHVSEITLEGPTLHQGVAYLAKSDLDSEDRALLANLKGVYVRDYQFDRPGQFSPEDLAPLREQLRSWTRIVFTRDRDQHESAEIYTRLGAKGEVEGLAILAVKPNELSFVNVVGPISVAELSKLHSLGIPHLPPSKPTPKPAAKPSPRPPASGR